MNNTYSGAASAPPQCAHTEPHDTHRIILIAKALAITAMLIGGLILAANYMEDPNQITLSAAIAPGIGIVLAGLALYTQCLDNSRLQRSATLICAILLSMLGIASLAWKWLAIAPAWQYLISMPPACALTLILTALALTLHDYRTRQTHYPAEYLSCIIIVLNLIVLLGHLYQIDTMTHLLQTDRMPLASSLGFIFLGIGLLMSRPSHQLMAIIVSNAPGGQMLRSSLPQTLALLLLVDLLAHWGARHHYYHYSAISPMLMLINCALISFIFWRAAARVDHEYGARIRSAAALAETTALLMAVSDNTHDPIFVKDNQGRLIFANPATLKRFNSTWSQAKHSNSRALYPNRDEADLIDQEDARIMHSRIPETLEQTLHFPEEIVTYQTTKAPWLDKHGKLLGIVGISTDITQRKLAENSLRERELQLEKTIIERTTLLRELTNHLETVREEEKQAIARELHDNMGASLTALSMHMENVYKIFPNDLKWNDRKARIQAVLTALVATTRRIQTELRPNMLDLFGLKAALIEQLEELSLRSGLICKASMPDEDVNIGHQMEIAIYRMLQEILNNAAKHAHASRIDLILDIDEDQLALTVRDDGVGMSPEQHSSTNTYGLRGLRERATFFGGKIDIRASPGRGTTVAIQIPLMSPIR